MAVHDTKAITCDYGPGKCEAMYLDPWHSTYWARSNAKTRGWTSPDPDTDLCPKHSPAENGDTDDK